jgi:predicted PurR-regulated permease PerM
MGDELNLRFAATLTLMNVAIVLAMYFLGIFALMLFSAGIVAYLMYPLKSFVIRKTRVPNWLGSLMITTIGVSIVAYAAAKIIPIIYYRVRYILSLLPDAIQLFELKWLPKIKAMLDDAGISFDPTSTERFLRFDVLPQIAEQGGKAFDHLWGATPSFIGGVLYTSLIPLFVFFILKDFDRFIVRVASLLPKDLKGSFVALNRKLDSALRAALIGQASIAGILGILYMAIFSSIGLPFGAVIGLVSGFCRMVPYLDVLVGMTLSLIVVFTGNVGIGVLGWVVLGFIVVQSLDGIFLTPKIIGKKTGLHPLAIILGVLGMGAQFGFWGVIVAVPSLAIFWVLSQVYFDIYRQSVFYRSV